jgi:hypothetical protein
MDAKQSRYANVALGVWLFISAFLWHHSQAQFTNSWLMGIIVTVVALLATSMPALRYVNTAAGLWLIISGFALQRYTAGTVWNNVIVGALVFLFSLVPARGELMGRHHRLAT